MATPRMGAKIRALRRRHDLTQAGLAEELGISASYLNLIEHDRRPLTAALLIKLAQRFQLDVASFAADTDARLVSELMEVFGDHLFEGHDLSSTDVRELVSGAPVVAHAVLTLYHALRESRETAANLADRLDTEGGTAVPWRLPSEEVSDLIARNNNYFPTLEEAADRIRRDAGIDPRDLETRGLVRYLQSLGVEVRLVEAQVMGRAVRRYDPKSKRLTLSELLAPRTRNFQLAHQIGLLTSSGLLDEIAGDPRLTTDESRTLCRIAMASYFAGALLMPYDQVLETAREARYDIDMLGHRFRASFEQVCHRLTNLNKPGAEGIPFHFVRVDIAGNISKRYSGSGMPFARFSAACPKWNVHAAFLTPGQWRIQLEQMPDGTTYFTVARTVPKGEGGYHAARTVHAIALGCELQYAREMVYSDGIDLDNEEAAVPIGLTCRLCERVECEQRAFPSLHKPLRLDENARGISFYTPVGD